MKIVLKRIITKIIIMVCVLHEFEILTDTKKHKEEQCLERRQRVRSVW